MPASKPTPLPNATQHTRSTALGDLGRARASELMTWTISMMGLSLILKLALAGG